MPKFSIKSSDRLSTCHLLLQELFFEVVKTDDCSVVDGHRARRKQNLYFKQKKSEKKWPDSRHNPLPSMAVDVAPYIKGKGLIDDHAQCAFFAQKVLAKAKKMGIQIRWGGDWDRDGDLTDQKFRDYWHYELISTEKEI